MFYYRQGEIPQKRHTQFRSPDGTLRMEELFSTEGFGGPYALLYHSGYPADVGLMERGPDFPCTAWQQEVHRNHLMHTASLESAGDILSSRRLMAFNDDVLISIACPDRVTDGFYRNGLRDEMIVVAEGSGKLCSPFGLLEFESGDMIVIPRGTTYSFDPQGRARLLVMETRTAIVPPRRYFVGSQFAEHSPFCERDIRLPVLQPPVERDGDFKVTTKLGEKSTIYHLPRHPFDVIGWDGTLYPYIFNARDFEPLTRRIHTMPHENQAFGSDGVVICCIVPRLLEYHPNALPAPPVHSNIDCDEILFNLGSPFFGDTNRGYGTMTHHPRGLYHGTKADLVEKTIGMREIDAHALMIDTFRPLTLTPLAHQCDDDSYHDNWRVSKPASA